MIALMLTIVVILTTVASHIYCHFPLFKKKNKLLVSSARNLTWKELLTYGTTVRLKIRLQAARPENTGQLYFLDWTLPASLGEKTTHFQPTCFRYLWPLSPKNTSLIQTVTHACCHLAMNPPLKNPNTIP